MVVFPLETAAKNIMNKKNSKKRSKKKNKIVYKDYSNANFLRIKGIPKFLLDTSNKNRFQFGYFEPTRNEVLLTKFFFNNVEFAPVGTENQYMVNMPIPTDFDRKHLEVIAEILSCTVIRPCFEINTFKGNTHIKKSYMVLNVSNFVITPNCISILVNC